MTRNKEKWQAHMNRVGASALREETAELSQYFSQFGGVQFGSDFETVDPQCYAPGGAPGCDFGEDEYEEDEYEDDFGARQKGVGRWTVEDERKWGGTISWDSPRVNRYGTSVSYTIEHDASNNHFLVYRDHKYLGDTESLGEAKARAKADLNYRTPEFGLTKIPAGIQLPPSWGVPDPSMVRPGETPEGWDSNLFLGETGTALFLGEE
jgi:hypothetical protein